MGSLLLIRHGQASFLQDDYDKLSAIGEVQSRILGEYWAKQRFTVDEVLSGPLIRQRRTTEVTGQAILDAGLNWPDLVIAPEFREYDGDAVMRHLVPFLCEQDARVRDLRAALDAAKGTPKEHRAFQLLFEVVTKEWVRGTLCDGVEPWRDFTSRVQQGIARLTSGEARGRRIAVFTSGGPIAVAMRTALGLKDEIALALNWQIRNSAVSEFIFSNGRFSLSSFNALPHLPDPSLWTYR